MESAGNRTAIWAVALLFTLLSVQVIPVVTVTSAGAAGSPMASGPPSSSPRFSPDYIILGELKGTTVVQSPLPRSFPIKMGGIQWASTYYTGKDLAQAYGASSLFANGFNGRGVTIAIIDAYGDPTIFQDVATFDRLSGLPPANLTVIPVGPYDPANGITYGWDAETALDVEAAHSMAPFAHINLVVGSNNSNALYDAVRVVVDEHLGNVVSMSWGLGENLYAESGFSAAGFLNYPYVDYYFQKGSQEGMTFFAASGDYGAYDGSYTVTADFPSSSPFVTAVGGTTLFLSSSSGFVSGYSSNATYQGEQGWSVSPQYVGPPVVSSGGGVSDLFSQPYYQAGAYPSAHRTEPDVSADANPYTGFVMIVEGKTFDIGGTSLASPLWAGMTADVDQYLGRGIGQLNPYLYSIYSNRSEYSGAFHQVSSGFNGEYSAVSGYNLVTGLGSPDLPVLASDLKSMGAGMRMAVSTNRGAGGTLAPAQYAYGDNITIAATATSSGSPVATGTFVASLQSVGGSLGSVPLTYNGSAWVARYFVPKTAPAGSWTITVSGASGTNLGKGIADVDVGASLAILSPVPYPYSTVLPSGRSFQILVRAQAYGGSSLFGQVLNAYLTSGGKMVKELPLQEIGGGFYVGTTQITAAEPQGSYILTVNGTGVGSVYEYFYVGEGMTGVVVGPNDEAVPSAAPGEQLVLLANAQTDASVGTYTSNITAKFYSLSGGLVASAKLQPSPDVTQFGDLNFFPYQQANFTVPSNMTAGFYKVQFISSYAANSTAATQLGNYTTGFYISGPLGSYTASHQSAIYEGQSVNITARITDSGGNPVTSGVFFATVIPSGYTYEAYVADFSGVSGAPMQYDPAKGEWEGNFQIPSAITSPNLFIGNTVGLTYGPYTVFISGESSASSNVNYQYSYVNVLPFTWMGPVSITPSDAGSIPLLTGGGGTYTLSGIAASTLSISGVNVTLSNDNIQTLEVSGSEVTLSASTAGAVTATNSTLSLVQGASVGRLALTSTRLSVSESAYSSISPALPTISVSGLSAPIGDNATVTITVDGDQLANGTLAATVDGTQVPLTASASSTGLTATGTIDAASFADGVHTLLVKVSQSDGMSATSSTSFATDAQASSVSDQITSVSNQAKLFANFTYGLAVVAFAALVLAAWAMLKKPGVSPAPKP